MTKSFEAALRYRGHPDQIDLLDDAPIKIVEVSLEIDESNLNGLLTVTGLVKLQHSMQHRIRFLLRCRVVSNGKSGVTFWQECKTGQSGGSVMKIFIS